MFSIRTALAAVIVVGSVSLSPAFAAYRHYPAYAQRGFDSRYVSLPYAPAVNWAEEQWFDRATHGGGDVK